MRPLRLLLDGFGSYRQPTEADFSDVNFFALTGPTGSGKSTLIDGLCFALYGTVPRWGKENVIAQRARARGQRVPGRAWSSRRAASATPRCGRWPATRGARCTPRRPGWTCSTRPSPPDAPLADLLGAGIEHRRRGPATRSRRRSRRSSGSATSTSPSRCCCRRAGSPTSSRRSRASARTCSSSCSRSASTRRSGSRPGSGPGWPPTGRAWRGTARGKLADATEEAEERGRRPRSRDLGSPGKPVDDRLRPSDQSCASSGRRPSEAEAVRAPGRVAGRPAHAGRRRGTGRPDHRRRPAGRGAGPAGRRRGRGRERRPNGPARAARKGSTWRRWRGQSSSARRS